MSAHLGVQPMLQGLQRVAARFLVEELPTVALASQKVKASRLVDVPIATQEAIARIVAASGRSPGPIAVGVGSRGIASLETIVCGTIKGLKAAGWTPFIVPAMGSHGAATAKGQAAVLASYGITAGRVGAPVRPTMETRIIGELDGVPFHLDRYAVEAGAFILVARVKPHTSFRGEVESGPAKMCAIGLESRPERG